MSVEYYVDVLPAMNSRTAMPAATATAIPTTAPTAIPTAAAPAIPAATGTAAPTAAPTPVPPDTIIYLPDPTLETAIRQALGKSTTGELTAGETDEGTHPRPVTSTKKGENVELGKAPSPETLDAIRDLNAAAVASR